MGWEHTSVNMELNPLRAAPGTPVILNSSILNFFFFFWPFANLIKAVTGTSLQKKYTCAYTQKIFVWSKCSFRFSHVLQENLNKHFGQSSICALEKEMATHSGILAWRIPGTEEPGGLLSKG